MAKANKILFLTLRTFSATGGIEKVCRVFCRALGEMRSANHCRDATVYSMYDTNADAIASYTNAVAFRGFANSKISFIFSAIKKGIRSDTIVLSHINLLLVGFLIKLLRPSRKLVVFAHGIEVWRPLSFTRQGMLKRCDRILAVSQFTKEKMISLYGIDHDKITVLNNCIDPYFIADAGIKRNPGLMEKYGFNSNDFILLTLTRLSSKELYKGYDHVLYSVATLRNKFPHIKYLIVGKYDETEKQRLNKIIKQEQLQQQVVFAGYIPDEALPDHYKLADLYVMPSKKEGFGIVFIEAMFYGLPVIAGNKDGSADALCQGKLGVLVNPDSQEKIDAAIETVMRDVNRYKPDLALLNDKFSYASYYGKLLEIFA